MDGGKSGKNIKQEESAIMAEILHGTRLQASSVESVYILSKGKLNFPQNFITEKSIGSMQVLAGLNHITVHCYFLPPKATSRRSVLHDKASLIFHCCSLRTCQ